jgi:integrase
MSRRRGYKKEVRPGVWRLVVSAGKKPDGTRKQSTSTFLGAERDAERMLTRLLADADAGRLRTPSRATLAEFLADWLPTVESTLKPSSFAQYSRVVRLELSPRLGALPLVRLSALDIQRYLATRAREGNLGPSALRVQFAVLRRALNQAVEWDLLEVNPCARVKPPVVPQSEAGQAVDAETAAQILEAAEGTALHLPLLLLLTLGIRRGELLALRWSDWQERRGLLTVARTLYKAGPDPQFGTPKSGKARVLVLTGELGTALAAHREAQERMRLKARDHWQEYGLILTRADGRPQAPSTFHERFGRFLHEAGLPRLRVHDTRHASASILLAEGVPLKVVSERLGHGSVTLTADLYGHVLRGAHEDASAKIEAALKRGRPGTVKTDG